LLGKIKRRRYYSAIIAKMGINYQERQDIISAWLDNKISNEELMYAIKKFRYG
jgi:hypothetical protein